MDYAAVLRARIVGDEQPARYPEGIGSAYMAFYAFTSESRATTPGPVTNVQAAIAVSPATAHITDAPLAAAATRSSARIHQHAASLVETQLDSATTATATASAPRCERPSVIARKLNTGRKGRTPKSEAMRWKDPEVQKRLRELKQLWRNGVLAQPVSRIAAGTSLRLQSAVKGAVHCTAWHVPSRTMSLCLLPTATEGGRHPAPRVQQARHQPRHRVPPLRGVSTA